MNRNICVVLCVLCVLSVLRTVHSQSLCPTSTCSASYFDRDDCYCGNTQSCWTNNFGNVWEIQYSTVVDTYVDLSCGSTYYDVGLYFELTRVDNDQDEFEIDINYDDGTWVTYSVPSGYNGDTAYIAAASSVGFHYYPITVRCLNWASNCRFKLYLVSYRQTAVSTTTTARPSVTTTARPSVTTTSQPRASEDEEGSGNDFRLGYDTPSGLVFLSNVAYFSGPSIGISAPIIDILYQGRRGRSDGTILKYVILNMLWGIAGSFFIFEIYVLVALIFAVTIIGIPFAIKLLKMSIYVLLPFGRDMVDDPQVGSGEQGLLFIVNVVWFLVGGIWIALFHLVCAILLIMTLIGIPFGLKHIEFAGHSLFPFGKRIIIVEEPRPNAPAAAISAPQFVPAPTAVAVNVHVQAEIPPPYGNTSN